MSPTGARLQRCPWESRETSVGGKHWGRARLERVRLTHAAAAAPPAATCFDCLPACLLTCCARQAPVGYCSLRMPGGPHVLFSPRIGSLPVWRWARLCWLSVRLRAGPRLRLWDRWKPSRLMLLDAAACWHAASCILHALSRSGVCGLGSWIMGDG